MLRLDAGEPIRKAMKKRGLSIPALAKKTKEIDGYGISDSCVGSMVSVGTSGRDRFSERSARLVSTALQEELEALFKE